MPQSFLTYSLWRYSRVETVIKTGEDSHTHFSRSEYQECLLCFWLWETARLRNQGNAHVAAVEDHIWEIEGRTWPLYGKPDIKYGHESGKLPKYMSTQAPYNIYVPVNNPPEAI